MKKAICIVLILTMLGSLTACSLRADAAEEKPMLGKIVLLTDGTEGEDTATVSSVWKGICAYGEETGCTYLRINALKASQEARLFALQSGMDSEVQVVVCLGPYYGSVVFEAQKQYPDVMFLLLDGEPHGENNAVYETTANTHCILFEETQAGFLAGYAAVLEGNTKLGFCGESTDPSVTRYGYGFIQGADLAGTHLGLGSGAIAIRYWYAGTGQAPEAVRGKMENWYESGTQLVFACNHGNPKLSQNVILAAEACGGRMIGADADRSAASQVVVCSAVKDYEDSVKRALTVLEENNGRWDADHAGRAELLGVSEDAVYLSDEHSSWRLSQDTLGAYQNLLAFMKTDGIPLDQSSSRELFPAVSVCSITEEGEG